jgi:hypothetical protein
VAFTLWLNRAEQAWAKAHESPDSVGSDQLGSCFSRTPILVARLLESLAKRGIEAIPSKGQAQIAMIQRLQARHADFGAILVFDYVDSVLQH